MTITTMQITEIQMDYFFSKPESVLAALNANIADGDEEGIRYILSECQRRGVDLAPAIIAEAKKYNVFFSKEPIKASAKPFRVPIQTKGN
jgi:hypothetical protein